MAQLMTITRSGQITLPKPFRELIGVKPGEKVLVDANRNRIQIRRRVSEKEFRAKMDTYISDKTRAVIEKDRAEGRNLTVRQMIDEYYDSLAGKAEMEREYGPRHA